MANLRHPEPARLATTSVGLIHDIIKHKKESLKLKQISKLLDELLNCSTDILPDNIGGKSITHSMHQPRVQARNISSSLRVSAPFSSL
jgi:hypothetical protein